MRPVPLLCQWLLPPLPPLQLSLPLWVPPMVSTPPHTDTQHLALGQAVMDQADMGQAVMDQADLDLDMAVQDLCMAPTWEHCSLMDKSSQNPPNLTRMLLNFKKKVYH